MEKLVNTMDERDRALFRKKLEMFGDRILEETITGNMFRLQIQRGAFYATVTCIDETPLCEIRYPCPFVREEDVEILSSLIRDPAFLFEFRKLVTAPDLLYTFEIAQGRFEGFSILSRIYKRSDEILPGELTNTIMNVMNYGILASTFISLKLGKNGFEQRPITPDQKNIDNPMFS
jgi:hypothetical protein